MSLNIFDTLYYSDLSEKIAFKKKIDKVRALTLDEHYPI